MIYKEILSYTVGVPRSNKKQLNCLRGGKPSPGQVQSSSPLPDRDQKYTNCQRNQNLAGSSPEDPREKQVRRTCFVARTKELQSTNTAVISPYVNWRKELTRLQHSFELCQRKFAKRRRGATLAHEHTSNHHISDLSRRFNQKAHHRRSSDTKISGAIFPVNYYS
jgi:hypothetical protein